MPRGCLGKLILRAYGLIDMFFNHLGTYQLKLISYLSLLAVENKLIGFSKLQSPKQKALPKHPTKKRKKLPLPKLPVNRSDQGTYHHGPFYHNDKQDDNP